MIKSIKNSALVVLAAIAGSGPANAEYNTNFVATISNVMTYDSGNFLFMTSPMPAGPCATYFIVTSDVSVDGRQMLLSRALMAKASGEVINIGYDNKTCVTGWYRVHRIG